MGDQKRLLEAALFISPKPLMLDDLAKILKVNSLGYVRGLLDRLQKDYENRGIDLVKTPEGWQIQVRQELLPNVAGLTPYFNISEGSKRTLAVIAYKEPVKQSEIIRLQGNKAYSYIKTLLRMNLINAQKSSRTKILTLTQEFERYFGEERERIKQAMDSEAGRVQRRVELQREREEQKQAEEKKRGKGPQKLQRPVEKKGKPKAKPAAKKQEKQKTERQAKSARAAADDAEVEKTEQPIEELVV